MTAFATLCATVLCCNADVIIVNSNIRVQNSKNINSIQNQTEGKTMTKYNSAIIKEIIYQQSENSYKWFEIINDNGNYGLMETTQDMQTKVLLNTTYQDIQPVNEYKVSGSTACNYLKVLKNGKWAIYSLKQKTFISNFEYKQIENISNNHYYFSKLLLKVRKSDRWAILSDTNISDYVYDDICPIDNFYNNLIVKVRKNSKWGLYSCGDRRTNYVYKEISDIVYDDIKYEEYIQKGVNNYEIDKLKGLKNNKWTTISKEKRIDENFVEKLIGNPLKDFGK